MYGVGYPVLENAVEGKYVPAIVIATLTSRALSRDTIYTRELTRRGVDLERRQLAVPVTAAVEPAPPPLTEDTALESAARALALSGHGILPVVGTVGDLAELPPQVTTKSSLGEVLEALTSAQDTGLPVLDQERGTLTGWITHRGILTVLEPL